MGMDNKIFTNGKISTILLKFAIPAIISLLVAELYNMVDTVFVGRYIGSNAIGALTIAFPIQRLLISIGMLIAVGTSTFVARSLGEKNSKALKQTIVNAFFLTGLSLILLSLVIFLFKTNIIYFLGASSNTYPYANEYISIILIGGIFQCLTAVSCYIMTALGNTKITLYANSLGAIINVIVNYLLVAALGFGVKGAAIATVFSQVMAFVYTCYKFKEVKKTFNFDLSLRQLKLSFNKSIVSGIFAVGFSTFIIEISDAVVAVILNNMLFSKGGDAAIIMVGVITRVSMFMFITIIGISSSMQPIVAYNYGAGNSKKMKEALKISIITVTIASFIFWFVLMVFATPIIGYFLKEKDILNETVRAFRICISILPFVGLYYIGIYYYQAIGGAKTSFLLSIYRQMVVFIPIALVLIDNFALMGAWISYPISDLISSLTSLYFIRRTLKEPQPKSAGKILAYNI